MAVIVCHLVVLCRVVLCRSRSVVVSFLALQVALCLRVQYPFRSQYPAQVVELASETAFASEVAPQVVAMEVDLEAVEARLCPCPHRDQSRQAALVVLQEDHRALALRVNPV